MLVFTAGASSLPCSWDVSTDCCDDWATYSPALQTAAAEYGAFTVWAATGRRYGLCTRTIRPCGKWCEGNGVSGYYWSDGTFMPYILNGEWRNCWCGSPGFCTCQPSCQILLPGPVAAIPITGVSQDGAVVPASSWRVDNGKWLVRTDGVCWPDRQNFDVDTGVGTLFVTYSKGLTVPSVLLRAAGELACEWAKSCQGQACRLPQRVQSVSRQGVSVQMVPIDVLLKNGFTGVTTVDQVIRNFNPTGLTGDMRVASPDGSLGRITTIA